MALDFVHNGCTMRTHAGIAQLVEQLLRKQLVGGSSPLSGTIFTSSNFRYRLKQPSSGCRDFVAAVPARGRSDRPNSHSDTCLCYCFAIVRPREHSGGRVGGPGACPDDLPYPTSLDASSKSGLCQPETATYSTAKTSTMPTPVPPSLPRTIAVYAPGSRVSVRAASFERVGDSVTGSWLTLA